MIDNESNVIQEKNPPDLRDLERRFEARIVTDSTSGCWNWTGTLVGNGYGYISVAGKPRYTHRVSAMLYLHFDLFSPLWVLHLCDNTKCVNPAHLRAGTPSKNARDAVAKGRFGRGKLTPEKVAAIKELLADGHTHAAIATEYGVTRSMISQIARGESWGNVRSGRESKLRGQGRPSQGGGRS
jgi:hypothetical protein